MQCVLKGSYSFYEKSFSVGEKRVQGKKRDYKSGNLFSQGQEGNEVLTKWRKVFKRGKK